MKKYDDGIPMLSDDDARLMAVILDNDYVDQGHDDDCRCCRYARIRNLFCAIQIARAEYESRRDPA